ncbi:MAG: branched-chain amino acid ABC transporter permease [Thermoleophilia bacterium]
MDWVNAILQGVMLGGFYALFATGLSLVFGVMKLVNLAHGDLSVLAAFIAVAILDVVPINPLLAMALVVPIMFVIGWLLQRYILDHSLGPDPMPALLVTFGLSVIIQNLLLEVFSADSQGLDAGRLEDEALSLGGGLTVGWFPLLTFVLAVLVLVGLQLFLSRTRTGRAFRATSDNQRVARLMGIDNRRIYALSMAIALGVVAVAGVFMGIRTTFAPGIGPARLIFAYEAVIMGGLGSVWGTLVGGIVLGVAQVIGAQIEPGWQALAGHVVFLAVLAFKPSGLLSRRGAA